MELKVFDKNSKDYFGVERIDFNTQEIAYRGNPSGYDVDSLLEDLSKLEFSGIDTNNISDGYHTFGELYEHRIILFIALCKILSGSKYIWRSKLHSDGSSYDDWFILGIGDRAGKQITYHLPLTKWDNTSFAITLDKAPEFDGHTSQDVLERISNL